jgi:flavin reductase (DIM6/NTAB) family NADH-FMN oxidoreductase RutF
MKEEKLKSISKSDIEAMERITRLNLINHITGYKSANLIGTRALNGQNNLSIASSVIHLSSSPALIGFMQRPTTVPRHTYANVIETGVFTLNHVHKVMTDRAHYTSAKFEREESEFHHCGIEEEYLDNFDAPFVRESTLKMAVRFINSYEISESRTKLVVGSIECIYIQKEALKEDGQVDLNALGSVAISGLNNYHIAHQLASYAYARPGEFPENLFQPQ